MVKLISRPYAGFFEIKYFNGFIMNRNRPWSADSAQIEDENQEKIEIRIPAQLTSVQVLLKRKGFSRATYFLNKYSLSRPKASIEYIKDGNDITLNIKSIDNLFRQEILCGESDKLLDDLEGSLIMKGDKREESLECEGWEESETSFYLRSAGLDMLMKYFSVEKTLEGNGYKHSNTSRTDTLKIKDKDLVVDLSRQTGAWHSEGDGQVMGGGCSWRPWKCETPLSKSIVEKLYDLLY